MARVGDLLRVADVVHNQRDYPEYIGHVGKVTRIYAGMYEVTWPDGHPRGSRQQHTTFWKSRFEEMGGPW